MTKLFNHRGPSNGSQNWDGLQNQLSIPSLEHWKDSLTLEQPLKAVNYYNGLQDQLSITSLEQ